MTGALAVAGAFLAWLGGSTLVLAEGRRALALGLFGAGAGLALTLTGQPAPALAVGLSAAVAGALRLRGGPPGWGVLPAGSTPRIILVAVFGVAGAFVGASLMPAPGSAAARAAIVLAGALAATRVLSTQRRAAMLASTSAICLALAAIAALLGPAEAPASLTAAAAAALIAVLPGEPAADA